MSSAEEVLKFLQVYPGERMKVQFLVLGVYKEAICQSYPLHTCTVIQTPVCNK